MKLIYIESAQFLHFVSMFHIVLQLKDVIG